MKQTPTMDSRKFAAAPTARSRAAGGVALGLIALIGAYAGSVRAEEPKKDFWCGVIEKQIERNNEESRKPHDSAGTERLREERRRIDKDAENHHCTGN
jgi:hypothetical protein